MIVRKLFSPIIFCLLLFQATYCLADKPTHTGVIRVAKISTYSCIMQLDYTLEDIQKMGLLEMQFEIQIDSSKPLIISVEKGAIFENLNIHEKHLITVKLNNKIIESFWVHFKKLEVPEICIWYDEWYMTWHQRALKTGNEKLCQGCMKPKI